MKRKIAKEDVNVVDAHPPAGKFQCWEWQPPEEYTNEQLDAVKLCACSCGCGAVYVASYRTIFSKEGRRSLADWQGSLSKGFHCLPQ